MSLQEEQELKITSTRRMDLAAMKQKGRWRFVNYFEIGGALMEMNGVLMPNAEAGGFLRGIMMGRPIMCCGFCDYSPIVRHFTLQNVDTGELLNVGSECVGNILDTDKSTAIVNGIASLQSKVDREFKRVVYHKQLTQWLGANVETLDGFHNEMINQRLAGDPEYYWSAATEIVFQFDERGQHVMEWNEEKQKSIPVAREVKVPEQKRKKDAPYHERRDRNYWKHMNEVFEGKDWNPQTMAKSFRDMISLYTTVSIQVPKMRKLTEDEKNSIKTEQAKQTADFIKRLGINLNAKYITKEEKDELAELRKQGKSEEYKLAFSKIKEKYGFVGKSITVNSDLEIIVKGDEPKV